MVGNKIGKRSFSINSGKTIINSKAVGGKLLVTLGFLLVFVGIFYKHLPEILGFVRDYNLKVESFQQSKQIVVNQSLGQGPIKIDSSLISENYKEEDIPTKILIPSLTIDIPIKQAKVKDGEWEIFEDVASFGLGSATPDKKGNIVIFAHARWGLFLPLKNIKEGTQIYVLNNKGWFLYETKEIKAVFPSDLSVIGPTEEETLTLYTCSGFADTKRLIVIAKRV